MVKSVPSRPQLAQQSTTSYNFHRNNKSLKLLNLHLKEYKEQAANEDRKIISLVRDHSYSVLNKSK
jgi:hypothetical protein